MPVADYKVSLSICQPAVANAIKQGFFDQKHKNCIFPAGKKEKRKKKNDKKNNTERCLSNKKCPGPESNQ